MAPGVHDIRRRCISVYLASHLLARHGQEGKQASNLQLGLPVGRSVCLSLGRTVGKSDGSETGPSNHLVFQPSRSD